MPTRLLSNMEIKKASPKPQSYRLHDKKMKGFCARITPMGRKTWMISSQNNGHRFIKNIGDASKMDCAEARRIARGLLAIHKHAIRDSNTPFEVVADLTFKMHERLWKPRTMKMNIECLRTKILPHFIGTPIGGITTQDVGDWFTKIGDTPSIANRSAPVLSAIAGNAV